MSAVHSIRLNYTQEYSLALGTPRYRGHLLNLESFTLLLSASAVPIELRPNGAGKGNSVFEA